MQKPILGGTPKTIFTELHECKKIDDATEREMFRLYRTTKNPAHREALKLRIVQAHLQFVFRMACDYAACYQLPVTDFYSAGKLGLLTALNNYNPESKTKFGSFAVWDIRWQMQQFIYNSDPIHIPTKVRQRVIDAKKKGKPLDSVMFGEEAANVLYNTCSTYDHPADCDTGIIEDTIADRDNEEDVDDTFLDPEVRATLIESMKEALDDREMSVICSTFGFNGYELASKDIAACSGVSKAYIRTIKANALEKLRKNSKLQELFEECTGISKT